MPAVWFTSRFTSMNSFESRSAIAATFMPMELSPKLGLSNAGNTDGKVAP